MAFLSVSCHNLPYPAFHPFSWLFLISPDFSSTMMPSFDWTFTIFSWLLLPFPAFSLVTFFLFLNQEIKNALFTQLSFSWFLGLCHSIQWRVQKNPYLCKGVMLKRKEGEVVAVLAAWRQCTSAAAISLLWASGWRLMMGTWLLSKEQELCSI